MKTDFQNMKRLLIAWTVAGIVSLAALIGGILFLFRGNHENSDWILYAVLLSLIPLGFAALAVGWRLTVKSSKTVSSILFILFTLACLALACCLILLMMLAIFLHPIEVIFPACLLAPLIVWYVLFFILRKKYSHLIGQKEKPDDC